MMPFLWLFSGCSVFSVFNNYSHMRSFTVVIFIWNPLEVAASKILSKTTAVPQILGGSLLLCHRRACVTLS